jgi:hypothetical protein
VPYLRNLIEEGGYNKQQMFNVDERALLEKDAIADLHRERKKKRLLILRLQRID